MERTEDSGQGRLLRPRIALRLYTRVARLGSFSAAARECGLSQSQASRIVADLEANLGARLLSRTTDEAEHSVREGMDDRRTLLDDDQKSGRPPLSGLRQPAGLDLDIRLRQHLDENERRVEDQPDVGAVQKLSPGDRQSRRGAHAPTTGRISSYALMARSAGQSLSAAL